MGLMIAEPRSASSIIPFDFSASVKRTRKSYTREFKPTVVNFYWANNPYQLSKQFSLNTKTILRWTGDKEKITEAKKRIKHTVHVRRAMYPEMETELHREYKALWRCGLEVKGFWFKMRVKQLLEWIDLEVSFNFSDKWFDSFKKRHCISFRCSTNVYQKLADNKKSTIRSFHKTICDPLWWWTDGTSGTVWTSPDCRCWSRHLSRSVLPMDQFMQKLETAQFVSEEVYQALRRDNVQYNLHCLRMGRLE